MNKRIRKKHLKRTLNGLLAAYDEYEAARERAFHKTLRNVADACGQSRDERLTLFRRYMEIASVMASSGPPLHNRTTSA